MSLSYKAPSHLRRTHPGESGGSNCRIGGVGAESRRPNIGEPGGRGGPGGLQHGAGNAGSGFQSLSCPRIAV